MLAPEKLRGVAAKHPEMAGEIQAMQQALLGMRAELDQTRAQLANVAAQNDRLAEAHRALERNTAAVVQAQMAQADAAMKRLQDMYHMQKMDLLNLKHFKPETFSGKENEPWKPWAKKTMLYLNGKAQGFRAALKWSEGQNSEIVNLNGLQWELKDAAEVQLHEFLLNSMSGRALQVVEERGLEGRGFEAWRRLKAEFEPRGGAWEVKVTAALLSPARA